MKWFDFTDCLLVSVTMLISSPGLLFAGPLDPPPGPVAPTQKTLDQMEPRTPINDENTPGDSDSVYRIAQPGAYYLTDDIVVPDAGQMSGIEIAANDVSIDLNGFTIRGESSLALGIAVRSINDDGGMSATFTGISIFNGNIRDTNVAVLGFRFNSGVLVTTGNMTLRDLRITGTAQHGINLIGGDGSVIESCLVAGAGSGIVAGSAAISNCRVFSESGVGIAVSESAVSNCTIEIQGDAATGMSLNQSVARGVSVQGSLSAPSQIGIEVDQSVVENCLVYSVDTAFDAALSESLIRGCAAMLVNTPTVDTNAATLIDNNF